MDSPLIYLTLCSTRNLLRTRLRRLREPRYLISLIVGVGYLVLVFGRSFGRGGSGATDLLGGTSGAVVQFGAACLLFVVVALAWVLPSNRRPTLAFTRADVQFLFTAPISRRRLVRYKILRSQLGVLFGSALVTFFMRPASTGQTCMVFIGVALMMTIFNLHLTGIALTRVTAPRPRGTGQLRRWLPLVIVLAAVGVIGSDLARHWPEVATALTSGSSGMPELLRLMTSGLSGVVLWPFRALVGLPLADSPAAFAAALPWALLILALNYVWVLRTDVPFEEASAELAEKLARVRKEGLKALRKPRPAAGTPFRLAPQGPPETAILWKNLISMGRIASWITLIRVVPAVIMVVVVLAASGGDGHDRADALAVVSLMIAAFVIVLGPQMTRGDLRQDLASLAVLRTWPLRGARLVRGEVLAPAAVLISIGWLALLAAAVFSSQGSADRPTDSPWPWLVAALAVTPGVILVQLLVQNGLAVTFPSWMALGPSRGGVDVMGQRMLVMFVSLLALVVTLLPAALLAGSVAFIVRMVTGEFAIVLPGLLAAVVLLVEAVIGSEVVGRILDRTDVSALDPADA